MSKPTTLSNPSGRLTLGDALRMLVSDGIVDKSQAEKLYKDRKLDTSNLHPIVVIGEQKWKSLKTPHKAITVEMLSTWLAERSGLEFFVWLGGLLLAIVSLVVIVLIRKTLSAVGRKAICVPE